MRTANAQQPKNGVMFDVLLWKSKNYNYLVMDFRDDSSNRDPMAFFGNGGPSDDGSFFSPSTEE